MKKLFYLSLILIAFSCAEKKEKIMAEVSCGQCQFGLKTQEGCDLAVRIDGKAYFVDGADIDDFGDAHDEHTGFCEVVREAAVVGVVEEGRFKTTSIELIEQAEEVAPTKVESPEE